MEGTAAQILAGGRRASQGALEFDSESLQIHTARNRVRSMNEVSWSLWRKSLHFPSRKSPHCSGQSDPSVLLACIIMADIPSVPRVS